MDTCDFLNYLAPNEKEYLFCCIGEQHGKGRVRTHKIGYDYRAEKILRNHNEAGDGIYITVNSQVGKGRKNEDMAFPRAVFQDDDAGFTGTYPLEPNIIVNTSPGKFQRYWLLDVKREPWDQEQWREWCGVQQTLIDQYGNDPSVKDPPRLMRLPGFYHLKNEKFKVTAELIHDRRYSWEEIISAFPPVAVIINPTPLDKKDHKLVTAMQQVTSGENFNDALCTISMWYIDKNMPAEFILNTLQALMNSSQEKGTARWQERFNHLPRMIEDGMKKKVKELLEAEAVEEEIKPIPLVVSNLPLPPEGSFLRLLTDDILASMRYPENNIAILGALHVINTFAGRQFSYEGMGLVSKRVLLAPPGSGKDSIRKYLSDLATNLFQAGVKDVYNYVATGSYTTDALMHNDLATWGMRSMIRSEAGFAGKSKAGDQDTLKQYTLQLLSKNHSQGHTPRTQRKKAEDVTDPIFQVSLAMLDESVPDSYIEVLRQDDAFVTGDFARVDIIVASGDPTTINKNSTEHKINPKILERIAKFILLSQNLNSPRGDEQLPPTKIVKIQATSEVEQLRNDFELTLVKRRKETRESDPMINNLLQRRYQKQSVLLLTVALAEYDPIPRDIHHSTVPEINLDHFNWVMAYQDALEETMINQQNAGTFDGPNGRALIALEDYIKRILSGELAAVRPSFRKHNIFTHSEVTNNFKRNGKLLKFANATCNGDTSRAMYNLLRELETSGRIIRLSDEQKLDLGTQLNLAELKRQKGVVYKYTLKI